MLQAMRQLSPHKGSFWLFFNCTRNRAKIGPRPLEAGGNCPELEASSWFLAFTLKALWLLRLCRLEDFLRGRRARPCTRPGFGFWGSVRGRRFQGQSSACMCPDAGLQDLRVEKLLLVHKA